MKPTLIITLLAALALVACETADAPTQPTPAPNAEKPAEVPAEKPAEAPAEKPAEAPAEKPAEKPAADMPVFEAGVGLKKLAMVGQTPVDLTMGMPLDKAAAELGMDMGEDGSEVKGPNRLEIDNHILIFDETSAMVELRVNLKSMTGGVAVGDKVLKNDSPIEDLKAAFEGCGELQINEGGNILECKGVIIAQGSDGTTELRIKK